MRVSDQNLEDFIRLIGRLRSRKLNVKGVVAGGGLFAEAEYMQKLQDLIRSERLESDCLMIGNLDPLTPFMKAIDIFVSTSKWETFGLSVAEAMACGKPAIAFDAGSLVEVIPDDAAPVQPVRPPGSPAVVACDAPCA